MLNSIYLLTGAAGFLGSNISRVLLEKGKKVRALVLNGDPAVKYVPEGVEIVYGDLTDKGTLEAFFNVPEDTEQIVIHCASMVYLKYAENQKVYDVNVTGTQNIVDLCVEKRVKKLVYISSTGAIAVPPDGEVIVEPSTKDDIKPDEVVGCYSRTKALATKAVLEAVESMGLDASIVYPAGICGPYDYAFGATAEFVENLCNGNMPVGVEGTFNSVDARDLAEGVVACVEKGRPGEGYIMSNDLLTIERMCRIMCDISGAPMPETFISAEMMKAGAIAQIPEDADREAQIQEIEYSVYNITRNNNFSCEKAKRELGYHTRPVEETIADEVAWLADEGKITIKNDVCVITGGGSGMGLEAAKLIGKTQKIVLAGRTVSKLELAKQELEELGVKVSVFGCDVSDRESVERLAEFAAGIGTIRSVIHAAGLSPHMGNGETIFGVNAIGTIHINEVFSKYMKQGGTIIDVSSMSAYMLPAEQVPYQVYELALENEEGFKQGALAMLNAVPQEMQQDMAYTVSKNFVLWYAKKSALKLGKDGIRVISVSPGTFDTPMGETEGDFPVQMAKNGALGRIGKPKEIASLFAFLVSDGASYITGTDILCDGGTIAAVQSAQK